MSLLAVSRLHSPRQVSDLDWSLLATLAYADVFEFPLRAAEAHRYLIGQSASLDTVQNHLDSLARQGLVTSRKDYFALSGRSHLVELREERAVVAAQLWPEARHYGRTLSALPFIHMVAVSGALAADNVGQEADIDYFLITEPGRLWLARAMTIAVVRLAASRGITLCPNYLVSRGAMELGDRNLFAARELAQLVPLSGAAVYRELRRLNEWTFIYLPNAGGPPIQVGSDPHPGRARRLAEPALRTGLFDPLERWEMGRVIRKLTRESARHDGPASRSPEASFCAEWCKGHLDGHAARALKAYNDRIEYLSREFA